MSARFSPAFEAQDPANAKGAFAPFAQLLLPQEYSGWAAESQAVLEKVTGEDLKDAQSVQHIEAGIATNGLDYLPSAILTPNAPP
ncbi:hypothetical protein ACFY36_01885 [Actinoplanes sp. NPDC000266]